MDAACGEAVVGEEAVDGGWFDTGDGEVSKSAIGFIGLPDEEVVAGEELAEVVGVAQGFDGSVGGFTVDIGEDDEGLSVADEGAPAIDDDLLSGGRDDLDGGFPVAGGRHGEADIDAGCGWGWRDVDLEVTEEGFGEGVAIEVAHFFSLDEDAVAAVIGAVPRSFGSMDGVAGACSGAGDVIGGGVALEGGFLAVVIGSGDPDLGGLDGVVIESGGIGEADAEAMLGLFFGDVSNGELDAGWCSSDEEAFASEGLSAGVEAEAVVSFPEGSEAVGV